MPAAPAPDATGMGSPERWVPGEYAECLHDAPWFRLAMAPHRSGPGAGDVGLVRSVVVKRSPWTGKNVEMLTFDRWPRSAFPSSCFRKVAKPKFSLRSIARTAKREPHFAGVGAAALVTAVCYGAAAVAQLFGSDQ